MAFDKVVDSAQLNGAMTATADAIRAKTSESASIAWSLATGFADAINAIPIGGTGWETAPESWATGLVDKTLSGSVYGSMVLNIRAYAFANCAQLTGVEFPECREIGGNAFLYCSALTSVSFPLCTTIGENAFQNCAVLTSVSSPFCSMIRDNAFQSCSALTSVNFSACTTIGNRAFQDCSALTSVNFPFCSTIAGYAFQSCTALTSVSFPVCRMISYCTFSRCTALTSVSFPVCRAISDYAFIYCYRLISLYLTGSSICTLNNSNAFISTPIGGYSTTAGQYGSIYVPASLLASYQAATNWTYFSSRFIGV